MKKTRNVATGRRKSAVARVYLQAGKGTITINHRDVDDYFDSHSQLNLVRQPLVVSDNEKSFDIAINVKGGGKSGQAGAIRLGIARALVKENADTHAIMREHGFLTRDSRVVERKKYGQPGARRKFQFSKR